MKNEHRAWVTVKEYFEGKANKAEVNEALKTIKEIQSERRREISERLNTLKSAGRVQGLIDLMRVFKNAETINNIEKKLA
jgi:hypothetical protein